MYNKEVQVDTHGRVYICDILVLLPYSSLFHFVTESLHSEYMISLMFLSFSSTSFFSSFFMAKRQRMVSICIQMFPLVLQYLDNTRYDWSNKLTITSKEYHKYKATKKISSGRGL